jgi:hypothetical protein
MAEQARVSSIRGLGEFRGFLVKFAEGVRHGLTTADADVQDTARWLGDQHPARLQAERRKAQRVFEQARDELRRKRLQPTASGKPPSVVTEQKAAAQAKAKLEWLEDKFETTRRWARKFDKEADQYRGATQGARAVADTLVPQAMAKLDAHLRALEDYVRPEPSATPTVDPSSDHPASVQRDGDAEPDEEANA